METEERLNAPFTEKEMAVALRCLRNHKSGGLESVPAECYKYATREDAEGRASNVLIPHLLRLMEFIRSTGDYPRQFAAVALSPIHKKGDVSVPGNYRGIAVGGALAKLYAFLLDRRLSAWAEAAGVRSAYQGGFRQGLGTVHNLFVLRHLTDMCRADVRGLVPTHSRSLFVCQDDFEKAFDRVPRELLWMRLEERGVHGACLDALKAAYARVEMHVRVSGVRAEPFVSGQGVKEGKGGIRAGWDTNPHPLGEIPSALLFELPGRARREAELSSEARSVWHHWGRVCGLRGRQGCG